MNGTEITKQEKKIIGRLELVQFPNLNDEEETLIAKIDTGADSGAMHADSVKLINKNGKKLLQYHPINESHKQITTSDFSSVLVKSSNGTYEQRYRISTEILIRGNLYPIELTLTDRSEMSYDVIIGRYFLEDRFLVDVSIENT